MEQKIIWIAVKSSHIAAIAHEDTNLYIRFVDGKEFEYKNVTEMVINGLLAAPSKGKYFNSYIKGNYTEAQLPTAESQVKK